MIEVVGLTPLQRPDAALVRALVAGGRVAFLDHGPDARAAGRALRALRGVAFGLRLPPGVAIDRLPDGVHTAWIDASADPAAFPGHAVWVEVRTVDEARDAVAAGASAVVGRGAESGGLVGPTAGFVLAQQLAAADLGVPVFLHVPGPHAAAACAAAGLDGVVLSDALSLTRESTLAPPVRRAIRAMDGSETTILAGHRVFTRPDLDLDGSLDADAVRARLGGDDLRRQLLPVGQGAALAAGLAEAHVSAVGVVAAVERAVADHLREARTHQPLAPGGALSRALGTRYPIAQGPMTRVSDTAAFAKAVADGGGLPFLALSMLRGPQARALLEETAALLGDRPWGAGILGFVPPEVREPQLEALAAIRPPAALIAGGRPSQARALEDQGIPTWLHVPSPALLDAFLADGARRFVFEGRECGGHVGPRGAFVLWEQAVTRLLAHGDDLSDVQVLFAGGVHDARSGAMVSALAAPLAARGAQVGVLMGTAYLFTAEAVAAGAIVPAFQEEAVAAKATALVETAPGHATRCVDTAFVRHVAAERARLEAEGVPPQEVWAALERLNLGRLRIASKGVVREGATLKAVDDATQRDQGMYMIGDVATMRHTVTTVAALHADVSEGAVAALGPAEDVDEDDAVAPVDVAIVGMAAILPGAPDLDTYWRHILDDRSAVTEVPAERWNVDRFYDPDGVPGETTPCKWGGMLPRVPFDPMAYGLPPKSLASIDPAQLLALEVSRRALADAGYDRRPFDRETASVIFGTESGSDLGAGYTMRGWYQQVVGDLPDALDEVLPRLTEDSFPGVLANVLAGRIANRLDLGGVNYTVDAACASSLASVDLACKELAQGSSDLVVCGGADTHNGLHDYLLFSSTHALSRKGRCATFDASADGIVLGEGVVAVVLKRLEDARRDGDRVYAVLRGVGGSSDGKSLGLTAPRREGQVRAVERAWRRAGVDRGTVGLVEAHGTGTVVGDRTELGTLTDTFTGAEGVVLGSVKSQIGHTKCAAGLAGLVKIALAVHHGVRPPSAKVQQPNPGYDPASSPFRFTSKPLPWADDHRVAAVSAFGFGGTNFHAVLDAEGTPARPATRPAELFLLRGTDAQVDRTLDQLAAWLDHPMPPALAALAQAACFAADGPARVALVAGSLEDLAARIPAARARQAVEGAVWIGHGGRADGRTAWLFPGQGSQRVGMLRDLFVACPDLLGVVPGSEDLVDALWPPDALDEAAARAQAAALTDTRVAQPALGLVDLAVAAFLEDCGLSADAVAGHSYGELAALAWAGAVDPADLPGLSRARARAILDAAPDDAGAMAAVRGTAAQVAGWLEAHPEVRIANHNAPQQVVVAGPTPAVEALVADLTAREVGVTRLDVACAFHSPVVAGARDAFAGVLAEADLQAPRVPVWSDVTAQPHTADALADRLAEQLAAPVRWVEIVEDLYARGVRTFVECGPGRVLTGLVRKILGDRPHATVAVEPPGGGWRDTLAALATLATGGHPVDAAGLFAGRHLAELDLARPPSRPGVLWWVDGMLARPDVGPLPADGLKPVLEPLGEALGLPAVGAASGDLREQTVLRFLDNMASLANAQRDAVLGLLGTVPSQVPGPVVRPSAAAAAPAPEPLGAPAPVAAAPKAPASLLDTLLDVVSDRTGYPPEMLDADLDLEADLSIDSIKRIEILGALGDALGESDGKLDDDAVEILATKRTLREMVTWLEGALGTGSSPAPAPKAAAPTPVDQAPAPVHRYRLRARPLHAADGAAPGHVAILDTDAARGTALAEAFRARGVTADVLTELPDDLVATGPVVHRDGAGAVAAYPQLRALLEQGATHVLGVDHGRDGLDGLYKTAAREYPDRSVRLLTTDAEADALAERLLRELADRDAPTHVRWQGDVREVLDVEAAPLVAGEGRLPLEAGQVVLLTGGARGITARIAEQLAAEAPATFVLVGRSPAPPPTDPPHLIGADDATALRKALVAGGERDPATIERTVRTVLKQREMRATFAALQAAGATVDYRPCDVRDAEAFRALLDDVLATHGRLDGVVHGAGVLDDKLMRDKAPEAFARVYETKVHAARVLADALPDDVGFVVFFGSVSGVYGNKGQADYAAANATLDALAADLAQRIRGRVVSIDWGPWAGAGMVSPELARAYAQKGIALIPLEDGVRAFLDELRRGDRADTQVIWQAGDPEAFGGGGSVA